MADEEEGMQDLIKLHRNRPNYARMISWELLAEEQTEECETEGIDEKDSGVMTGLIFSKSDAEFTSGDEYFSATEGISDPRGRGGAARDSVPEPARSERKSQSKKRRKQNKLRRLQEHEFSAPFQDIPSDILIKDGDDVRIYRNVPSLSELCLHVCNFGRIETVPPGLRPAVHTYRQKKAFQSRHLKWLHSILAHLQKEHEEEKKRQMKSKKEKNFEIGICGSIDSIWKPFEGDDGYDFPIRANVYLRSDTFPYDPYHYNDWVPEILGQCIELMLPSTVRRRHASTSKKPTNDEDILTEAITAAIISVKMALMKRYPALIKDFYPVALGYALWSRGVIYGAAQAFILAIESKSPALNQESKGFLHCEIGRMYAMFGDLEEAGRSFMDTASVSVLKNDAEQAYDERYRPVGFLLQALVTESGTLDEHRALNVRLAWNSMIENDFYLMYEDEAGNSQHSFYYNNGHKNVLYAHAASSLIKYTTGYADNGKFDMDEWFHSVTKLLLKWAERSAVFRFYLTFINALKGRIHECTHQFEYYKMENIYEGFDGSVYSPSAASSGNRISINPWQAVLDQAVEQKRTIRPIKLLWRKMLVLPAQLDSIEHLPSDLCLNLIDMRLTEEGLLTGNISLHRPALLSIHFDPYTGRLIFPSIPAHSQPLHDLPYLSYFHGMSYSEYTGPLWIRLIESSNFSFDFYCVVSLDFGHRISKCIELIWSTPDGHKTTIDLRKLLRLKQKEIIDCSSPETMQQIIVKEDFGSDFTGPPTTRVLNDFDTSCPWSDIYCVLSGNKKSDTVCEMFDIRGDSWSVMKEVDPIICHGYGCINWKACINSTIYGCCSKNESNMVFAANRDGLHTKAFVGDICDLRQVEDFFILVTQNGFHVIDPTWIQAAPVHCTDFSKLSMKVDTDDMLIQKPQHHEITVINSRLKNQSSNRVISMGIAWFGHVLLLEAPYGTSLTSTDKKLEVDIVLEVKVVGYPRELCLMPNEAGFLVTTTLVEDMFAEFWQDLYQFNYDGQLCRVLTGLGGESCMFKTVYLEENCQLKKDNDQFGNAGWHVYFCDHAGAIACFNASDRF
ncbi:uncharacterized protein LOC141905618 isoform X2 [Tubulanus polymorphus]|uniref:uncharacterized protein LOC141905618 isoform X2 n=1 Tax=Tubulanus polymorphus TaxID=672921 RepID=UPI003DA24060